LDRGSIRFGREEDLIFENEKLTRCRLPKSEGRRKTQEAKVILMEIENQAPENSYENKFTLDAAFYTFSRGSKSFLYS
jgi:hypothetical protein